MNKVTAIYRDPNGQVFETTFASWATNLIAQYNACAHALNQAFNLGINGASPGLTFRFP